MHFSKQKISIKSSPPSSIHRLCIYNLLYISKWKTIYIHLIEDDAIHLKQQRIQFIKHAWNSCIHSKYFRLAVFVEWKRQFGLFCLAKDKNSSSCALWRRHVANELCAEWLNYATYISVALPGTFNIDFNLIPFCRCARSHANNFVKATKVLLRFSIVIFIFFLVASILFATFAYLKWHLIWSHQTRPLVRASLPFILCVLDIQFQCLTMKFIGPAKLYA